jgi:DNA-binding XRE family transcriptional regulator
LKRLCKLFDRSADWFLGLDNGCDVSGFPQRIVELREIMHLTQGELAELLGVARQAVNQWENGWAERKHYLMVLGAFHETQRVMQDGR